MRDRRRRWHLSLVQWIRMKSDDIENEIELTREESKQMRQKRRSYWKGIKEYEERTQKLMAEIEEKGPELRAKKAAVASPTKPTYLAQVQCSHRSLSI